MTVERFLRSNFDDAAALWVYFTWIFVRLLCIEGDVLLFMKEVKLAHTFRQNICNLSPSEKCALMQLFACSLCALNHMLLFCRLNASCLHQGVVFRVSGLTGRHVRNLCSRSESGAAGIGKLAARCRGTCPQWKAPLSSWTGVCRAVKPLTWSEHTLNYSHLYTGPSVNVKVTVHWPSAFPPALFFSVTKASFLPRLYIFLSSIFLRWPFNQTAQWLPCVFASGSFSQLIYWCVNAALLCLASYSFFLLNGPTLNPRWGGAGSDQVHLRMGQWPCSEWKSVCLLHLLSSETIERRLDQLIVGLDYY